MLHACVDRCREQSVARKRIVTVIFERLLDAFRNDDRTREMQDRADALLGEYPVDQIPVGDIPFVKGHVVGNEVARSRREIVDDCDGPAGIAQSEYGVAADVAGAAGHEHWKLTHGGALA